MIWNGAQFHMLVNHLPVIGFIGVLPAIVFAIVTASLDIKRFVLGIVTIVGLTALAPYWTGESAEETIEHLPGVDKALIHEHEEAAELATVFSVVTGIAAAGAFLLQRKKAESMQKTLPALLVLSLITAGVMGNAAHEGGKIRHSEIRAPGPEGASAPVDSDSDD